MTLTNKASVTLEKQQIEAAQDRLLSLLKTRGESSTAELAGALAITGEAVRQQLVRLQAKGLVESTPEVRGVGRPLQRWKLTAAANRHFPDAHAQLSMELIQMVRKTLGEPALQRLIEAQAEERLASYSHDLGADSSLEQRLDHLVVRRNAEGYMAEWHAAQGEFILTENHCPICSASSCCGALCQSELDLFQKLLGSGVTVNREEHIVQGARRCVYRIRKT